MQKVVLVLFFLIIVVVAAFNIVGTQLIVARERVKEIATLVALGASKLQLMRVFVVHGFVLGLAGVIVGLVIGRLVVWGIQALDFGLDPQVYLITKLPAVLHWKDVVTIALSSLVVVFLSCVLSSWRATRLNPVDGLRKVV
jgi:lipoprotein-releasing system permease protein